MARVRAETVVGNGDCVLEEPDRLVRPHRLGDPGDEVVAADGDGTIVGRLVEVAEVPITHIEMEPGERERLSESLGDDRMVFVHRLADSEW
jgi:hypothetical protein